VTPTHRIALAALLVALAAPASAEAPCVADAKRFCDGTPATQLVSCLQAHRPDLAPACVQRLERVLVFFQTAASDCRPDAFELCREAGPGMAMIDCLRSHEGKLTPRCQQFFDAVRGRDESLQRVCGEDVGRVCPGVAPGRGELWMCLWLNGKDVSPACQAGL
jgi:hypothetical protein